MQFADIIGTADVVLLQTDSGWNYADKKAFQIWQHRNLEIAFRSTENGTEIYAYAKKARLSRIVVRWKHNIDFEVKILGDHWERSYGDLEWRGFAPERIMPWYFIANCGDENYCYGVKTGANSLCFWQADKDSITLCMDVRCGGSPLLLENRELHVATLVSLTSTALPFATAKNFCSMMCDKPILPSQPVYGGNNWYYAYGESSHREILEDSNRISELAGAASNRPFMIVDDGWQRCHNSNFNGGPWTTGNSKFPDMQKLAYEMKNKGVKPGLWLRPLLTSEKVPDYCVLRSNSLEQYLDPSVDDVLELVSNQIERIAGWGYELIKHDFSTYDILGRWGFQMYGDITDGGWSFSDKGKTTAEIIKKFYRTIREAAKETMIMGCNTIGHLSAGLFEIQRTGDDTSGLEWERTRRMGINTLAFRMPQHGFFFAIDADCVGITRNIPWEKNKQWLNLLALSGTPLFISLSADAFGDEQKIAIRHAFESASKKLPDCDPIDWMNSTCPSKWLLNNNISNFKWSSTESEPYYSNIFQN
jgi:alpha-galactosidase